jgi:hypothetical protein
MQWTSKTPSESAFASYAPEKYEQVSLCISLQSSTKNDTNDCNDKNTGIESQSQLIRRYMQDRDINLQSKKVLQHHLSAMAIQDIISNNTSTTIQGQWSDVPFDTIRNALSDKKQKGRERSI